MFVVGLRDIMTANQEALIAVGILSSVSSVKVKLNCVNDDNAVIPCEAFSFCYWTMFQIICLHSYKMRS